MQMTTFRLLSSFQMTMGITETITSATKRPFSANQELIDFTELLYFICIRTLLNNENHDNDSPLINELW